MTFWDFATGTPFQNMEDIPQPGSLEAESGLFCSTFDMTGTRLITGSADKTIKVLSQFIARCRSLTNFPFTQIYAEQTS
jgi:pleiotropic regulator 1